MGHNYGPRIFKYKTFEIWLTSWWHTYFTYAPKGLHMPRIDFLSVFVMYCKKERRIDLVVLNFGINVRWEATKKKRRKKATRFKW